MTASRILRIVLLVSGVYLLAMAAAIDGTQAIASFVGGALLGVFVTLQDVR